MKSIIFAIVFLFANLCTGLEAFAQEPIPVEVVSSTLPVPVVLVPSPEAVVKTVEEVKLTVKDEAFVPPEWLQDALMSAKSLPVIGPFIVKAMQWLGVIVSLLTALFAFLWAVLRSLQAVMSAAQLYGVAEKLAAVENSKAMYYLKALSAFNAQKKDKPA